MSRPTPFDAEAQELYDRVTFVTPAGMTTTPGAAAVRFNAGIRQDVREVDGEDGATVTFLGHAPAEATITVTVWTAEQYNKLRAIVELLRPKRGTPPEPVDVVHPSFELAGISSVYVFDVSDTPPTAKGGYTVVFSVQEWWSETKRTTKAATPVEAAGSSPSTRGSGRSISDHYADSIVGQSAPSNDPPGPTD